MSGKRLHFIVGKGGVGKSTLTAAMALAAATPGRRVLAVELGEPGGLCRLFERIPNEPGAPLEVRPGLSIAYVEGDTALSEYLEIVLPIRRLLAGVFASKIYRYFVAAAPGLKELMTIGKIWFENQKTGPDGRPFWDAIYVDAGASGHSLQYLQMPTTAAETFGSGLVHREARRVESLLKDGDTTAVHVAALPEDMPLVEAAQIVKRLREDLDLPIGRILVNRCRRQAPSSGRAAARALAAVSSPRETSEAEAGEGRTLVDGVRAAADRALAWEEVQEVAIAQFCSTTALDVVRVPALTAEEFGLPEVEQIARMLHEAAPESVR